jgi:hypothetical protein
MSPYFVRKSSLRSPQERGGWVVVGVAQVMISSWSQRKVATFLPGRRAAVETSGCKHRGGGRRGVSR